MMIIFFRTEGLSLSLLAYILQRTVSWEDVLQPLHPSVIVSIGLRIYRRNDATVNEISGSGPVVCMGLITDSIGSSEQSTAGQHMDEPVDCVSVHGEPPT
jgi:hypothetical protein